MTNAETNAEILAASAAHEIGVYARQPVAFVRGRGAELWDADGKRYLDFFAGLAVNNLGHCHPAVVHMAPIGSPPPSALARVMTSGATPACSWANSRPVRPMPHCTSSKMRRSP